MQHKRHVMPLVALAACCSLRAPAQVHSNLTGRTHHTAAAEDGGGGLVLSANSLSFIATLNGAAPPSQSVTVSAPAPVRFTVSSSASWLGVSPSGTLTTNRTLAISANPSHLAPGNYTGRVSIVSGGSTYPVQVTLNIVNAAVTATPGSLSFSATAGGTPPAPQTLNVTAPNPVSFTASVSVQGGSRNWLSISPTTNLRTPQKLTVSVNQTGLPAGNYTGSIALTAAGKNISVPVTLVLSNPGGSAGKYTLIGWNDLGMHCQDGQDFSVFAVLPPFNTIHAHLIDPTGKLITSDSGYTVTYQAVSDPLTNTLNTTSSNKTNFWQFASALGFGSLAPDTGLKGFSMPGAGNKPQAMTFTTSDNTWTATGIPVMPYADAPQAPYPVNYFPMMRLVAKNSLGAVLASTDIVLPVSDELSCGLCHASGSNAAAKPVNGWVKNADPAKDMKLNILRKHDDRFNTGLEASVAVKPLLCASCHGSNALGLAGAPGVEPLTTAVHSLHARVVDPATNQTMDNSLVRDSCYRCHPGPKTQCLRGAMGSLKTSTGANAIECQSCHGNMSAVAASTRNGWLDEPNCQACHSGTAIHNSGQIAYTSAFSSGTTLRIPADTTFATNPNTPAAGISLYRFSKGHGGVQCEACHGSTHAEFATTNVNDNVQSTALQGHAGVLAECATCHGSVPNTVSGGPHGLHPIGVSWVSTHPDVVDSAGATACQTCHGADYRGTILSKTLTDRSLAGKSFPKGTVIGCYSCHNGPNGG